MTEEEVRKVELIRAIETEDRDHFLLTREDRQQADAYALTSASMASQQHSNHRFVARRAEFAAARLTTRNPGITALLKRSRWPRWIGWSVPLAAVGAGFLANEFGSGNRLDLLAVPLIGTIVWNLLVYAGVLYTALTGRGKAFSGAIGWVARLGRRDFDRGTALHRAAGNFQQKWGTLSAPLTTARIARVFHLGAALFAAGLIGGIYLRALVTEYRAGWESTFLGPEFVHAALTLVLGPASLATGVAIPPVEKIAAMRWTGETLAGVNAAPWIYLYTATIVGLVIIPRIILALWQGGKAILIARNFPIAGQEDFYLRRLMRTAGGNAVSARITPYAYRPDEQTRRRLQDALRGALDDNAQLRFDEPVEYGAEDNWLNGFEINPADDYHILLFTLSATPEEENHGAIAVGVADRIRREKAGTILAAIIDENPFRTHFAGQAGLVVRIETRIAAWRSILSNARINPLAIDLARDIDDALAQKFEAGLLPDGSMQG